LLQAPLSRFGDTAANVGVLALTESSQLPLGVRTATASLTAGLWRIVIIPIDALKTSLQATLYYFNPKSLLTLHFVRFQG